MVWFFFGVEPQPLVLDPTVEERIARNNARMARLKQAIKDTKDRTRRRALKAELRRRKREGK